MVLEGRYTRLEPINAIRHGPDLYTSTQDDSAGERFRFLFEEPPTNEAAMQRWIESVSQSIDPMFFAVVDKASGRAEGRQALMRIDPTHGVIEIGHILWGPSISRTRVATEAMYLIAAYVFETLGYRRLEWKCNNQNNPSKHAALRFGFLFEGLFRQHMVVKGRNRDTAWFAMTDDDWLRLRHGYISWLQPDNFVGTQQKSKLSSSHLG